MTITKAQVEGAKPRNTDYLIYDGGRNGLVLRIGHGGTKTWYYRFRWQGKGKKIKLGVYPWVTISQARQAALENADLVSQGIDPRVKKRADKNAAALAGVTLRQVGDEWFAERYRHKARKTIDKVYTALEKDIYPWIGDRPIKDLETADLWEVVDRVRKRGARQIAGRVRGHLHGIFERAVNRRIIPHNIAADLARIEQRETKHHATLTSPVEIGELIRKIRTCKATFPVKCMLELAPLFFVRSGKELREARWSEFDFDHPVGPIWEVPASRDKMQRGHLVPLSTQSIAILRDLHALTGRNEYVFVGRSNRPVGHNTINEALKRLGYAGVQTIHGFRAMARTLLRERLGFETDVIERQLAHKKKGVDAAYDRAEYLVKRQVMMQRWADYLDELANGVKAITPLGAQLSTLN